VKFIQMACFSDEKYTLMNTKKLHSKAFFNESLSLVLVVFFPKFNFVSSYVICVV
jgi:hypothetical protein